MRNKLVLFAIWIFLVSSAYAGCSYSGTGDWNITDTDECTNSSETIVVNGNLTVWGNLTLHNVTLSINATDNASFIQTYENSVLTINASNLTSENVSTYYNFTLNDTAFFVDSSLEDVYDLIFFANSEINDSNISNSAEYDLHVEDANVTVLRTDFDSSKVNIVGTGELTVKWYLWIRTLDTINGVLSSVNVTLYDVTNATLLNELSDATGYVSIQTVTEYIQNATGSTYYTPHTINVSKLEWDNTSYEINVSNNSLVQSSKYNLSGSLYTTTNFLPYDIDMSPDINESLQFMAWESDDWGMQAGVGIVLPNSSAYDKYAALGTDYIDIGNSWSNSTLENTTDMDVFFNFWNNYTLATSRDIVVTPMMVMGAPNYTAIRANDFTSFVAENISDGFIFNRLGLLAKYQEGYQNGTWLPQYHGYINTNYRAWMEQLYHNDTVAHTYFNDSILGFNRSLGGSTSSYIHPAMSTEYKNFARNTTSTDTELQNFSLSYNETVWLVSSGKQVFYDIFNYYPTSTVVPNYQAGIHTPTVLQEQGFLGTTGGMDIPNETCSAMNNPSSAVCRNRFDYNTLTINRLAYRTECDFFWMSGYTPPNWNSTYCRGSIESNLAASNFVAVTTHQIMFTEQIYDSAYVAEMYNNLTAVLDWIGNTYPDLVYVTTPELHQLKIQGYSIQPWYNQTVVRNYLEVDKIFTLNDSHAPTNTSSWTISRVTVRNKATGNIVDWSEGSIVFTAEPNQEYVIYEANILGESCSSNGDCTRYCVHSTCREDDTFCGDGFCDSGESTSSCSSDCPASSTTTSSDGSGSSTPSTVPSPKDERAEELIETASSDKSISEKLSEVKDTGIKYLVRFTRGIIVAIALLILGYFYVNSAMLNTMINKIKPKKKRVRFRHKSPSKYGFKLKK
jgi:hypothetical protein